MSVPPFSGLPLHVRLFSQTFFDFYRAAERKLDMAELRELATVVLDLGGVDGQRGPRKEGLPGLSAGKVEVNDGSSPLSLSLALHQNKRLRNEHGPFRDVRPQSLDKVPDAFTNGEEDDLYPLSTPSQSDGPPLVCPLPVLGLLGFRTPDLPRHALPLDRRAREGRTPRRDLSGLRTRGRVGSGCARVGSHRERVRRGV